MEKTEELIEIIRNYPILYDTSHQDYKDNRIKNKIWESIAESMEEKDGDIPKSRWKNLRDSYSKHLRAINGEESKYIERYRCWPWVTQMSFLQPFIEVIPTRSNRGVKKCKTSKKQDLINITKIEESELQDEDPIYVETGMIEEQQDVSQYLTTDDKTVSNANNISTYDETDLIFLGYSKLIKKMSRKQQALVKYKIAKVIMDAEMEVAEKKPKKFKSCTYEYLSDN